MIQTWVIDQKPQIWLNLGPICPNLGQIIFFSKIGLCHFLRRITKGQLDAKNQSFRGKLITDRRMDGWQWIYRTNLLKVSGYKKESSGNLRNLRSCSCDTELIMPKAFESHRHALTMTNYLNRPSYTHTHTHTHRNK